MHFIASKKGPGSPGTFKKSLRLFGPRIVRVSRSRPVLSLPRTFPGPSRDLRGQDSPAGNLPTIFFRLPLRPCLEYSGMGQMGKPANGLRHMTSQKKNVLRTSWLALNITICIEHVDMYCTITIFSGQTGQWFGRPLLLLYNTWHQTAAANRRTAATDAGPFKIASKFKI